LSRLPSIFPSVFPSIKYLKLMLHEKLLSGIQTNSLNIIRKQQNNQENSRREILRRVQISCVTSPLLRQNSLLHNTIPCHQNTKTFLVPIARYLHSTSIYTTRFS
jgi:hypothetical protein